MSQTYTFNNIIYSYTLGSSIANVDGPTSTSITTAVILNSFIGLDAQTYTVTSISDYAFQNCNNLTSVDLSGCTSLTSIGNFTFLNCTYLSSVTFPSSLTSIGYGTFYSCTRLTSFTFPSYLTSIGNYTFQNCTDLSSVTFPSSLTSIGEGTFYNCTGLTSVTFPSSLTTIGDGTFSECTGLISVTFPSSLTSIGDFTFENCKGLTSVTFPSSLTSIGDGTFENCSGLTSVTFPSSLTTIGDGTFYNCTSLTSVDLSGCTSLTTIGDETFSYCTSLTSVTFPSSLTTIGDGTFYNCTSLTSITFYNTVSTPTIGVDAFTNIGSPSTAYYLYGTDISSIQNPPLFTYYVVLNPSPPLPCFLIGSLILTDQGYRPVQYLKKGDLIKTLKHGFLKVEMLGKGTIYNSGKEERIKDRLYRCSQERYSELMEDLILTGCHSVLVEEFISEEQRKKTIEVNGNTYVTDKKYRLPVCADEKAIPYEKEGNFTIYHLALENDNYIGNYGIYANGLLVESCSLRYLKELSNMELMES